MTSTQWNFDLAHSTVGFKVRHMMFSKVKGRFAQWEGSFEFNPENPSSSHVKVELDVSSIDTGVADRDAHLKSNDFFDAASYPTIAFESKSFDHAGESNFQVVGDLTIRGVTKEIALDVEYHGQGVDPWGNKRVGFSASGELHRKDYGLNWNQALEAGGVLVGDKVEVEIEVQAVQVSG